MGAAQTAYVPPADSYLRGYLNGRADGLRTGYATAAGLSEQSVRDRIRIEAGQ